MGCVRVLEGRPSVGEAPHIEEPMSPYARTLPFALLLSLSGCELIVDFPSLAGDAEVPDAALAERAEAGPEPAQDAAPEQAIALDAGEASTPLDAELVVDAALESPAPRADASARDAELSSADADAVADDASAADAATDGAATSICDPLTNAGCIAGERCLGVRGCMRCDPLSMVGMNGCEPAAAVCRLGTDGRAQCTACLVNADCGASGFCDTASGACTNVCDPDGPLGDNGCSGQTPYCGASGAGYACRGCAPTDCAGTTPYCVESGALAGSCVACRDPSHCVGDPQRPVCDLATLSCRVLEPRDCSGATPVIANGRCAECLSDTECGAVPGRPYCGAGSQCVSCAALPSVACSERSPASPLCDTSRGACARCLQNSDCSAALTPSVTPICVAGACVACNAPGVGDPATVCSASLGGSSCVLDGPQAGRCATLP
jgi:hypothetical protein